MKRLLLTLILTIMAFPTFAQEQAQSPESWLKPVEAKYICMMNNAVFEKEQMAIEVDGKTYYGCCAMCADKLKTSAEARTGTDPVSGNPVDKATAVIGADPHGKVYYFENPENFQKFASGPMPEGHGHMEEMDHMEGMEDMGMESHDDHQH